MAEFDLLLTLKEKGLPVPTVHACCVKRSGLFYTLKRSLHKLHSATAGSQTTTDELDRGIAMLRQSWETSLRSS